MGAIKEVAKKHWVLALDEDLAGIPTPAKGDTVFTEDKNKFYYYTGAAWKTGLGYEFVPRNVTGWDKQIGTFTADGTWKVNGLDLSGIVPADAKAVALTITLADDAAGSIFFIRRAAADQESLSGRTQVANIAIDYQGIIAIDSDRLLDYKLTNLVYTIINVAVVGWWI